jgi:hypothetical protein
VTKPPKHWVDLPWPIRVDKDSRRASGLVIGEEYIPPTFDYSSKNIVGRMSSGDDGIEHVKLTAGQVIPGNHASRRSDWNIVPDPSSDGGFRLVESSFGDINPTEIPQQGSSSSTVYENGDTYQENKGNNHEGSSKILGIGMTGSAADISGVVSALDSHWPSNSGLGSGMSSAGIISTGVSVPSIPNRPSANVLGNGMSSAAVLGSSVYIGSGYQRPTASVLGEGVGSGSSVTLSSNGNQPMLHRGQKGSRSGQQQSHSVSVESSTSRTPSTKTDRRVSAHKQLQPQFPPAAHWHVSNVPVGHSQKLASVATGVAPTASRYLSPHSPRSQVRAEASSLSTS